MDFWYWRKATNACLSYAYKLKWLSHTFFFSELVCHTCPLNAVCVDGECSCIKGFYFIDNTCKIEGQSAVKWNGCYNLKTLRLNNRYFKARKWRRVMIWARKWAMKNFDTAFWINFNGIQDNVFQRTSFLLWCFQRYGIQKGFSKES